MAQTQAFGARLGQIDLYRVYLLDRCKERCRARLYIGARRDIITTDLSENRRMNARITEIELRRLDGRLRGGDFRRRLIARGDSIVIFLPAHRAGSYKRRITFSLRARAG